MSRLVRLAAVVGTAALVGAAGFALTSSHSRAAGSGATGTNPTLTTARVQRTDLVASEQVTGTLGFASGPSVVDRLTGTYTALPAEGTIIQPGESLFSVDTMPVVLLRGPVPAWRAFAPGMSDGIDVVQLQRALVTTPGVGAVRVDGKYGRTTVAAVKRWQRALGLAPSGTIELGRVIFLPGAVRVGPRTAALGDPAAPGQAPYTATGATRTVTIDLDVVRQSGVRVGEPVTIELPSGHTTAGRVATVGRVAQLPGGASTGARPSITVTVALIDPHAGGSLDQQPVAVDLTTATHTRVLAVPITALLALREGGFGVEVVDGSGRHRIVPVAAGMFTQTLVEVSGSGIRAGMTVVTAQ